MDNQRIDDLFDHIFDEALAEEIRDIEIPDPDSSWELLSPRIDSQARRRHLRSRLQLAGMLAAAMVLGAFLFGGPQRSEAFLPVTRILNEFRDDVLSLFQGDKNEMEREPKGMLTSPPPPGVGPVMGEMRHEMTKEWKVFTSLDEAGSTLQTSLPKLEYIPPGYSFSKVNAAIGERGSVLSVTLQYLDEAGGDILSLNRESVKLNTRAAITVSKDTDKSEEISINGYEGIAILSGRRKSMDLFWRTPIYSYYLLAGKLELAEMKKIAESVQ